MFKEKETPKQLSGIKADTELCPFLTGWEDVGEEEYQWCKDKIQKKKENWPCTCDLRCLISADVKVLLWFNSTADQAENLLGIQQVLNLSLSPTALYWEEGGFNWFYNEPAWKWHSCTLTHFNTHINTYMLTHQH